MGTRDYAVPASACGVPGGAQAYSLNSWDGRLVANAAIVPTTNGSISAYASDLTTFFFDINGYFAR